MQVVIFVSHFNPCSVSTTPSSPKIASQLHPGNISNLSSSILYVSHHFGPVSTVIVISPSSRNISPPSRCRYSCHTSNRTSTDHLHAGHISPPSKWRYKYHLHPHPIPPQPWPIDSHLNSVQVACHLKLCPDNCISPPSKWRINSFLSLQIASELHSNTITNPYRSKDVRRKSHPNWIQAPSPM